METICVGLVVTLIWFECSLVSSIVKIMFLASNVSLIYISDRTSFLICAYRHSYLPHFSAYSTNMIEMFDHLCRQISPDVIPLVAGGDSLIDAVEKALLYFIRDGALSHVLGHAPFAFAKFNRACVLLEGLFRK